MEHPDVNARIAGLLQDLAAVQTMKQKARAYRRAAGVVLGLDRQLDAAFGDALPKLPGLGPSSMRVVSDVLETGGSVDVERTIDASGKRAEVDRRRALSRHFISRAEALRVLADTSLAGVAREDCRGDLQMHTTWSDGAASIPEMALGCLQRGYQYMAVTDHSYGLPVAGGMSMTRLAQQQAAIDTLNDECGGDFRVIKGIETNIAADGSLDLSDDELGRVELVLAAPHSRLRVADDQTSRLLQAVATPGVHVLAHPRGRMAGSRAGIQADWRTVFGAAARASVAVELDGDPSRQDLDHTLARMALDAGCLFAVDSDAHSVAELQYTDIALAHARLAGIPADRIVNCWPLDRLLDWMHERRRPQPGRAKRRSAGGGPTRTRTPRARQARR